MAITDPYNLTFGGYTDPNTSTFGYSDVSSYDNPNSGFDWSGLWTSLAKMGSGLFNLGSDLIPPAAAIYLANSDKNRNNKNIDNAISSMKPFNIPGDQLNAVAMQISGNQNLSNSARNLAIDNLGSAAAGKLSSAYQPIYDQTMTQAKTQLQERLSAQGFNQNSTQYNSAMEAYDQYAASTYARLLQSQVGTALQAAGLSDMAIKDYLNLWGTQSSILGQNNNMYAQQAHLYNEADYVTAQDNAALGQAIGNLGGGGGKGGGGGGNNTLGDIANIASAVVSIADFL